MRGRRLWTKFSVHGGEIRVYVTTRELELDGEPCDAIFDPEVGTIELKWVSDESHMKMKLLHELLHVCFKAHSGDIQKTILSGKTSEQRNKREELVVSFLEPVLYDLLARNKWLKLPRPPKLG